MDLIFSIDFPTVYCTRVNQIVHRETKVAPEIDQPVAVGTAEMLQGGYLYRKRIPMTGIETVQPLGKIRL